MITRESLQQKLTAARNWRANENKKTISVMTAAIAQINATEPVPTAGLFAPALDTWQPDTDYPKNKAFVYNDAVYFTRQVVRSAAHQPPGSTGMEAIYGVRPIPDENGIYPYVYNMAAASGMRIREGDDIYLCTRDIDPLLYSPSQVPAHFDKE